MARKRPQSFSRQSSVNYWRQLAHQNFDELWQNTKYFLSRPAAYDWLSRMMNVDPIFCHFSMFDEKQCRRAIAIVKNYKSYHR